MSSRSTVWLSAISMLLGIGTIAQGVEPGNEVSASSHILIQERTQ